MQLGLQIHDLASDELTRGVAGRDATLWVGRDFSSPQDIELLCDMIELPWEMVLCESNSAALTNALKARVSSSPQKLTRHRGFLNIIASTPPDESALPARTLPVYFLNGREDAASRDEGINLGKQGALRRRSGMIGKLVDGKPRHLIILCKEDTQPLDDALQLWEDSEVRPLLTVVSEQHSVETRLKHWATQPERPPVVSLINAPLNRYVPDFASRILSHLSDTQLNVRMRNLATSTIDITSCELVEQPILDRYDLILERDLQGLLPHELSNEDINAFFDRSGFAERSKTRWAPYAAKLPWPRDQDASGIVLDTLKQVLDEGPDEDELLILPSEPGAGGTTMARLIAFEAAAAGFPTLVATPAFFKPDLTEISRFLLRVRQITLAASGTDEDSADKTPHDDGRIRDVPWLIVFDVHHWRGRELELSAFLKKLSREKRAAVILYVADSAHLAAVQDVGRIIADTLTHEMSAQHASSFGEHLNQFLRPKGRARSTAEWVSFWEMHTPRIGTFGNRIAAFWVALEFFLKHQLNIQQTIQSWLYAQFKSADISKEMRLVLLQIAAMSVERQPLPEGLLPSAPSGQYPFSVQLEDIRRAMPALALMRYSTASDHQWAISHDLLARYLLDEVQRDRAVVETLELPIAQDSVALRLNLLRSIATRSELGTPKYRALAVEFAVNIFKLSRDGNFEVFTRWRDVLDILEGMPRSIWNTSRAFNHHVAISRRRLVRDDQLFGLSFAEKKEQLEFAIEDLKYAIENLGDAEDEERDLNIFNSLALAYQDLAEIVRTDGNSIEEVRRLSDLATEAARRAYEEEPNSPYVLETLARDLIQQGRNHPEKVVENACQALTLLFQATKLDSAPLRQQRLSELVQQAILLLQGENSTERIGRLSKEGNAVAFVAKAWLALGAEASRLEDVDLQAFPQERLVIALQILDEIPRDKRSWLSLTFQYHLLAAAYPSRFSDQLKLLDDLQVLGFRLSLQQQLERSLLLHQCERHNDANDSFRSLRRQLREKDAFVQVPSRLRVLKNLRTGDDAIFDAVIVEAGPYRANARVEGLGNAEVRLIPQDFGMNSMRSGYRFKCLVTFGWKGPLAKPPSRAGA